MQKWLFFVIIISALSSYSQTTFHYLVKFKNKSSLFSIDAPGEYLSSKSLARRVVYKIDIDSSDIPVSSNYIDSVIQLSVTLEAKSKWHNCIVISSNLESVKDELENFTFIKSVELIGEVKVQKKSNSKLDYGANAEQIEAINLNFGHNLGYNGDSVEIAIIDAGFSGLSSNIYFDSLFSNNQIKSTYNFVTNQNLNYQTHFHGTNVASILGANLSGRYIGYAPKSMYHLLVSEDINQENKIEEFHLIEALEYCDSIGVDVINISLGYNNFDDTRFSHEKKKMTGHSTLLNQACNMAWRRGAFIVTSAGNSGNNSWGVLTVPANADSVFTVGAVDISKNYVNFSSKGNPAVNSTNKPNVVGIGKGVYIVKEDGAVGLSNGTSFSSPQIAGLASCLIQAFPDKKNWEIREAIEKSGHNKLSPDSLIGYGIPNFESAHYFLMTNKIFEENKDIIVYPNPSEGYFTIAGSFPIEKINIYNTTGLKVFTSTTNSKRVSFNLNFLSAGLYFLESKNKNHRQIVKIEIL